MSQVFGLPVQFNDNVTFLKNTTFFGNLNIEKAQFLGSANFSEDVTIQKDLKVLGDIEVTDLYVKKEFGVGVGLTFVSANSETKKLGISTSTPREFIEIRPAEYSTEEWNTYSTSFHYSPWIDDAIVIRDYPGVPDFNISNEVIGWITEPRMGVVGIGLTNPADEIRGGNNPPTIDSYSSLNLDTSFTTKLDIKGNLAISGFIVDSDNLIGKNGAFLSMDQGGIQWVETVPDQTQGILIQNNSNFIVDNVGTARTFDTINVTERNSLGTGIDGLTAEYVSQDAANIVRFVSSDFWGYIGNNIYRMTNVGILKNNPLFGLDVGTTLNVDEEVTFNDNLDVDGLVTFNNNLDVDGAVTFNSSLDVDGLTTINSAQESDNSNNGALHVDGGVGIKKKLNVAGITNIESSQGSTSSSNGALTVSGGVGVGENVNVGSQLDVTGTTTLNDITTIESNPIINSTDQNTGILQVKGGAGITKNLHVGEITKLHGELELESTVKDINDSVGPFGRDYRLSSVGTGVSWRPSGVQTLRTIWVSESGNDANSGLLEGDAMRTIGAAAEIAQPSDTIVIRPGTYDENNPIGLRTDVSVTGQDLRLVTIRPQNLGKDIFHVRRGCLIENVNFACKNPDGQPNDNGVSILNTGGAAVAFPPPAGANSAVSGFTESGPATEGPTGRWRSPYIRNCTNFMSGSIGMKIDGDHATVNDIVNNAGNNLKSMVCDSFTQYNENGIGVSLTNNAYAQLVSIFTINCDIGIYASSGGQCDLTNSNSSFGNYGLYADGLGTVEYTGVTTSTDTPAEVDIVVGVSIYDDGTTNPPRRPYDGQAVWFKIDLGEYPDAVGTGQITAPLQELSAINLIPGAAGNSPGSFSAVNPPAVSILDGNDNTADPKGPQGVIAEASATVNEQGVITSIDVISNGRNYLSTQNIIVDIDGNTGIATAVMSPIYFTVFEATPPSSAGISTITFNEIIPYELPGGTPMEFRRISRILTSSHSFEYIGAGTSINNALPFVGAIPIKENEVVAINGAQIPFTSTDQKGNFDIGEGIQVNQTTSTITGRDFSRAIQAEVTPLILALR